MCRDLGVVGLQIGKAAVEWTGTFVYGPIPLNSPLNRGLIGPARLPTQAVMGLVNGQME